MKFELIPVKKIPKEKKRKFKKRGKNQRTFDEIEIAYMNKITGRDTRPSIRR